MFPATRSFCRVASALLALGSIFAFYHPGRAAVSPLDPSSSAAELVRHARYLASEELAGRGVDTPGLDLARDYIARELKSLGLAPGGDDGTFFQSLDVVSGVAVVEPSRLAVNGRPLDLARDWQPLGFSRSGAIEGEVVFAGYGITAADYDYNDYAGLDVEGKIVLVLRYEPPPKNDQSPFRKAPRYSDHATFRAKARNARAHGAIGMILVDLNAGPGGERELIPVRRSLTRGGAGLVAAQITGEAAEAWLRAEGLSLTALKERIDREEKPAPAAPAGLRASLDVTLEKITRKTQNVVGILPGADPDLKPQHVIVGAHYDHLGLGRYGNPDSSTEGRVHHGADDNASGTAVVLEVARRLSAAGAPLPRAVVFALFTGEELGLYGSRHYVEHPPYPMVSARAMINLDMVGRLKDNRVTVAGIDAAGELRSIIGEAARKAGLEIRPSARRGRNSDHASFNAKGVPAVHFFTGVHRDYHRPSDTWEKLNIDGMARIVEMVSAAVETLAATDEPLLFVRAPASSAPAQAAGYGSYLGTIPDFGDPERGVRVAGVQEGSPAAGAGLREGDVIVRLDTIDIAGLEDLAAALRARKPGDEVEIVVLRAGARLTLKTVLKRRG